MSVPTQTPEKVSLSVAVALVALPPLSKYVKEKAKKTKPWLLWARETLL